jgi:hypothetical protein
MAYFARKTRLEHELKEVTDVFKGELDEVNGKLATSERMLSQCTATSPRSTPSCEDDSLEAE